MYKIIYRQATLLRQYAEVIVNGRFALDGMIKRLIGKGCTIARISRIA